MAASGGRGGTSQLVRRKQQQAPQRQQTSVSQSKAMQQLRSALKLQSNRKFVLRNAYEFMNNIADKVQYIKRRCERASVASNELLETSKACAKQLKLSRDSIESHNQMLLTEFSDAAEVLEDVVGVSRGAVLSAEAAIEDINTKAWTTIRSYKLLDVHAISSSAFQSMLSATGQPHQGEVQSVGSPEAQAANISGSATFVRAATDSAQSVLKAASRLAALASAHKGDQDDTVLSRAHQAVAALKAKAAELTQRHGKTITWQDIITIRANYLSQAATHTIQNSRDGRAPSALVGALSKEKQRLLESEEAVRRLQAKLGKLTEAAARTGAAAHATRLRLKKNAELAAKALQSMAAGLLADPSQAVAVVASSVAHAAGASAESGSKASGASNAAAGPVELAAGAASLLQEYRAAAAASTYRVVRWHRELVSDTDLKRKATERIKLVADLRSMQMRDLRGKWVAARPMLSAAVQAASYQLAASKAVADPGSISIAPDGGILSGEELQTALHACMQCLAVQSELNDAVRLQQERTSKARQLMQQCAEALGQISDSRSYRKAVAEEVQALQSRVESGASYAALLEVADPGSVASHDLAKQYDEAAAQDIDAGLASFAILCNPRGRATLDEEWLARALKTPTRRVGMRAAAAGHGIDTGFALKDGLASTSSLFIAVTAFGKQAFDAMASEETLPSIVPSELKAAAETMRGMTASLKSHMPAVQQRLNAKSRPLAADAAAQGGAGAGHDSGGAGSALADKPEDKSAKGALSSAAAEAAVKNDHPKHEVDADAAVDDWLFGGSKGTGSSSKSRAAEISKASFSADPAGTSRKVLAKKKRQHQLNFDLDSSSSDEEEDSDEEEQEVAVGSAGTSGRRTTTRGQAPKARAASSANTKKAPWAPAEQAKMQRGGDGSDSDSSDDGFNLFSEEGTGDWQPSSSAGMTTPSYPSKSASSSSSKATDRTPSLDATPKLSPAGTGTPAKAAAASRGSLSAGTPGSKARSSVAAMQISSIGKAGARRGRKRPATAGLEDSFFAEEGGPEQAEEAKGNAGKPQGGPSRGKGPHRQGAASRSRKPSSGRSGRQGVQVSRSAKVVATGGAASASSGKPRRAGWSRPGYGAKARTSSGTMAKDARLPAGSGALRMAAKRRRTGGLGTGGNGGGRAGSKKGKASAGAAMQQDGDSDEGFGGLFSDDGFGVGDSD